MCHHGACWTSKQRYRRSADDKDANKAAHVQAAGTSDRTAPAKLSAPARPFFRRRTCRAPVFSRLASPLLPQGSRSSRASLQEPQHRPPLLPLPSPPRQRPRRAAEHAPRVGQEGLGLATSLLRARRPPALRAATPAHPMPMSMSAVTSSPSPAASPRAAFHVPRSAYPAPSPRARPASQTTAPSPKRSSWNAPPPAYTTTTTSASGSKPPHVTAEQRGAGEKRAGYVDAGTQYSPDGYPPTAGGAFAAGGSKRLPPPDKEPDKKRKQRRDDSPEPMSTSGSSPGSSTAARRPPPEPEPRVNPQPVQQSSSSSSQSQQPEPQEARSTHTHSSAKRSRPEPGQVKMMPILYQNCHPKELGVLISNMLMELIRLNDQIPLRDGRLTRFHSRAPPGISVNDYLQRLIHHATLSPPILLSMVWYIDRLCQLYPAFTINSLTVHRFLITAVTVAAKGLSDSFWTNPTYAKIGGIPVSELATLELEFLQKVHWKIVPQPEVLEDYYRSLVERTDGYELEGSGSNASSSTSLGSTESEAAQSRDEEMVDEPT